MDGCSLNQLGPRTESEKERKRQRKRERTQGGGGASRTAEIISTVRPDFFFSAVVIPFSSTAGHRESLQSVEYLMAQLSLLTSES